MENFVMTKDFNHYIENNKDQINDINKAYYKYDALTVDVIRNLGMVGFKLALNGYSTIQEHQVTVKTFCKKGCSNCCHGPVNLLSEWEEDLIIQTIKEKNIHIDFELIEEQVKIEDHVEYVKNIPFEKRKCVFLENNLCSIYEDRPLMCRHLLTTTDTNGCDKELSEELTVPLTRDMLIYENVIANIDSIKPDADTIAKAIWKHKDELR